MLIQKVKFVFYYVICFLFISPLFYQGAFAQSLTPFDNRPIYLVLLMDSSGSMRTTDPEEIRKLASQAVITLMSPDDKVAVVEFDSDAKILSSWKSASERNDIFRAIREVGKNGSHTDFSAGLDKAKELILEAPDDAHKVVLLLSDGIFDPNPRSDRYPPYYLQYRLAIRGKDRSELKEINEEYRRKLTPVARSYINAKIMPSFNEKEVEVYSVGFSPGADREFLGYLADETSLVTTESHFFYASEAIDLIDAFMGLIHSWKNKIKLYAKKGSIIQNRQESISFDRYWKDISFIVLTQEKKAEFSVMSDNDTIRENPLPGTHPKLKIVDLGENNPSGRWNYSFMQGSGQYRLLIVGRSTLDMEITGIQDKYEYGEILNAVVSVSFEGNSDRDQLGPSSKVISELSYETHKEAPITLQDDEEGFRLRHRMQNTGVVKLKFKLDPYDSEDRKMLTRTSKEYKVRVLPRFYVEPDFIDFGDVEENEQKTVNVQIHSGLPNTTRVTLKNEIKEASRCIDLPDKLPTIQLSDFTIETGQSLGQVISVVIPEDGCYGHFEGEILFTTDRGDKFPLGYRVHVPSWLEWLTISVLILLLILLILMVCLAIIWGFGKAPIGVLRPVSSPPGDLLDDIVLGRVKRNIWSRYLNWRKNVISLGLSNADIVLSNFPPELKVELKFRRIVGNHIQNSSEKESGHSITVNNPEVGIDIERFPGESYELLNGLIIKIDGYEFIFENL